MRPEQNRPELSSSSILLLGIDDPIALPVVRSLGWTFPDTVLHGLSRRPGKEGSVRYSRYLRSHGFLESQDESGMVAEIVQRIRETNASLLLPADEFFVRFLSLHREQLADRVRLPPLPEVETFDKLVNKYRLNLLLEEQQFPHARSVLLDHSDRDAAGDQIGFPCLIKPVRGSAGKGIRGIATREELRQLTEAFSLAERREHLLQEFIPGQNIDCSFLALDGAIRAYTVQKGLSSHGFLFSTAIRLEDHPGIIGLTRKLVELTGYSGLAHLDFRLDERDGQPKLIDFNARFWYSLLGSKASGVDFAGLYCQAAEGTPFPSPRFTKTTYLMGRSSIRYLRDQKWKMIFPPAWKEVLTDLGERVADPLPEVARFFPPSWKKS